MDTSPIASYHFKVDFENSSFKSDSNFTSVSGIDARIVFENEFTNKPGGAAFGDVVLKRPLQLRSKLTFSVLDTINTQRVALLNFTISLLDSEHTKVITWFVTGAQPARYAIDEFDATKSAIAVETFSFRCASISLTKPRG